jgi:hypothetical protein
VSITASCGSPAASCRATSACGAEKPLREASDRRRAVIFRDGKTAETLPPGCFLEVLILKDFKSLFPEVLILLAFKSFAPEVLILVDFKFMRMSEMQDFFAIL